MNVEQVDSFVHCLLASVHWRPEVVALSQRPICWHAEVRKYQKLMGKRDFAIYLNSTEVVLLEAQKAESPIF
jgi:hypothetical protein